MSWDWQAYGCDKSQMIHSWLKIRMILAFNDKKEMNFPFSIWELIWELHENTNGRIERRSLAKDWLSLWILIPLESLKLRQKAIDTKSKTWDTEIEKWNSWMRRRIELTNICDKVCYETTDHFRKNQIPLVLNDTFGSTSLSRCTRAISIQRLTFLNLTSYIQQHIEIWCTVNIHGDGNGKSCDSSTRAKMNIHFIFNMWLQNYPIRNHVTLFG